MGNAVRVVAMTAMMAVIVSGCARREPPAQPTPPVRQRVQPPPVAPERAATPANYVARAASIDLFEIRSAELVLQRSTNRAIREFASMMIPAHRGTSAQLSFAGRRLNLLPTAELLPRHEAMLHQLTTSLDVDRTYRQQQRAVHEEALRLHRAFAARGSSATLRPVAASAAAIVERHMRLLRYLPPGR